MLFNCVCVFLMDVDIVVYISFLKGFVFLVWVFVWEILFVCFEFVVCVEIYISMLMNFLL